jgi:O-antigen ligase
MYNIDSNNAIASNKAVYKNTTFLLRAKSRKYSKFIIYLFLIMAAYLAMPIIDIPLMGLSLSAPIFFLIALQVFLKPTEAWWRRFRGWIILALFIWLGVFISVVGNGLISGGVKIDSTGLLYVIRYAYWLLVFVVTAYFASRGDMLKRVSDVLGWAIFGLGLLRLFEALAWNKVGAWTGTQLLSQNNYGFIFSMFFPFLIAPIVTSKGSKRLMMIARLLVTGAAVIVDGSRGSWIGVTVGIFAFMLLFILAKPQKIGWSLAIIGISTLLLLSVQFAPQQIASAFSERLATFQKLEEDKSYAIRQLMVQKGLKLFEESPLIGVGASRFTKESVPLDIPAVLSYTRQYHFDNKSAHNSYIAILAETGILGSLPFAILLIILAWRGLKVSLKLGRRNQIWAISIYAGFIGMSIHMWGIASITNTANWFLYGLLVATIVTARRVELSRAKWT